MRVAFAVTTMKKYLLSSHQLPSYSILRRGTHGQVKFCTPSHSALDSTLHHSSFGSIAIIPCAFGTPAYFFATVSESAW